MEGATIPDRLKVDGKSLEVLEWSANAARGTILLIHEALGSASYWKDFPQKLALSAGCNVIAYSRAGHGYSEGPLDPRSVDYYSYQVEKVLPGLLRHFRIAEPILYGHSEGAAIAFLYAAAGNPVRAIIAESPIVVAEEGTLETVKEMNREDPRAELIEKLGRYHRDASSVFHSWVESVEFHRTRGFPSASYLPRVQCPVLVIHGALDPFGGPAQATALEAGIAHLRQIVLPDAGHLPHREQPEAVLENVAQFLKDPFVAETGDLV